MRFKVIIGNGDGPVTFRLLVGFGLILGVIGIGGPVWGCWNLLQATRLSLLNIREQAELIGQQQAKLHRKLKGDSAC